MRKIESPDMSFFLSVIRGTSSLLHRWFGTDQTTPNLSISSRSLPSVPFSPPTTPPPTRVHRHVFHRVVASVSLLSIFTAQSLASIPPPQLYLLPLSSYFAFVNGLQSSGDVESQVEVDTRPIEEETDRNGQQDSDRSGHAGETLFRRAVFILITLLQR